MYHANIYNKFQGNNATFQNNFHPHFVPPPPVPPLFFYPPIPQENLDQDYIKSFESKTLDDKCTDVTVNLLPISEAHTSLRNIILTVNELKIKEFFLSDNISMLSEIEWDTQMKEIEEIKVTINKTLADLNSPLLDMLCKSLAKRAAKRLRLKRVHREIKREKEEKRKELEENSRKIDENLQKIKDDIAKAQQEQEAKLEADVVLKEVLRKKQDAKKCMLKLDALVKLRKARQNTAKGRGENVSENETLEFITTIEKLKCLWTQKLLSYDKEETDLRNKLKDNSAHVDSERNATEREVASNLDMWRDVMFGGQLPQVDFRGDVEKFIAVRSQWDQYISAEGTTLPVGWVPPKL